MMSTEISPVGEPAGTVLLVDLAGKVHAKHSQSEKDIILCPAPSADPNDPLNWSRRRKWLATACSLLFTWSICYSSSACYAVFAPIHLQSGISFDDLNQGTGYMFLLFGWGLLLWQPLALTYGRRGVYLTCLLGTCLMNVWAGYAATNGKWIATRILIGFFGAPSEALVEVTITDLVRGWPRIRLKANDPSKWFTHQRGTYMGLYAMSLFGGQWAAVPSGFISDAFGWPWVLWTCAILNAFAFVVCFFLMEETMYHRDSSPRVAPYLSEVDEIPEGYTAQTHDKATSTPAYRETTVAQTFPMRTYWQKLWPFTGLNGHRNSFLEKVYRPLTMLRFPGIIFAGFIYGCFLNWFAMVNAVNSLILTAPPYNWEASVRFQFPTEKAQLTGSSL